MNDFEQLYSQTPAGILIILCSQISLICTAGET